MRRRSRDGVQVDAAIRFLSDARADDVANRKGSMPLPLHFAQGRQRVGRLAALRDREHQRVVVDRRIAIAQLARVFDFDGQPGEFLEQVFATKAECQLVPQAVRIMRSTLRNCCGDRFNPPKCAVASSTDRRPRMALRKVSGCSKISLSMKWS